MLRQHARYVTSHRGVILSSLLVLMLLVSVITPLVLIHPADAEPRLQTAVFTLDGIRTTIHTSFLPTRNFLVSKPGNASQVAVATTQNPFREVSITVVPYGRHPITEEGPVAQPGSAAAFRASLHNYRVQQDGQPQAGPFATLFGKRVSSQVSLVRLQVSGQSTPVAIVEWVVEAGNRIWIVRASAQQPNAATKISPSAPFPQSLRGLTLTSTSIARPTTVTASSPFSIGTTAHQPTQSGCQRDDLSCVPWWVGSCGTYSCITVCDTTHNPGSKQLGSANFDGLVACGPRPQDKTQPDYLAKFGAGGAYEWECVELVMRYLYLAYQLGPYSLENNAAANVVRDYNYGDYPSSPFRKISSNDGSTKTIPQAGDIIAADGGIDGNGHTWLVLSSTLTDSQGDGSIFTLEENGHLNGLDTLNVRNWIIQPEGSLTVNGWLHLVPQVVLYDSQNYDPSGATLTINSLGSFDLTSSFNDKTSSIRVPPTWVVTVYKNADGTGGHKTFYQSDANLSNDYFDNTNITVNNNISLIQVFVPNACTSTASRRPGAVSSSCQQPPPCVDSAQLVSQSNNPGGSTPSPGQQFTTTFQVRNTSGQNGTSCTWSGYSLAFAGGDSLGGSGSVAVNQTQPGQTTSISVSLVAPSTPGTYSGSWQLENSQGVAVPGGMFTVSISVPGTGGSGGGGADLSLSASYPTVVSPGQQFWPQVTVTLFNGQLLQSRGDMLRNTDGNLFGAWPLVAVTGTVNPGQTYVFTFYSDHPITAPSSEGDYQSNWEVWENGAYVGPSITIAFTVKNGGGTRPNTPTPTSPGNWFEARDGTTPQLCASDSSGNIQYDFQIHDSAQTPDSGWINGSCWTPPTLGPYTFTWHVQVRDNSSGLESGWSDDWHFTIDSQQLTMDPITFSPPSPSAEDGTVWVRSCVQGFGNVNLGLSYAVNTATDGSANGDWHGFANGGNNCPDPSQPTTWGSWPTRDYADGDHLVRATGYGPQGQTMQVYAVYHLDHRRPQDVQLLSPINNVRLNTRSVTFVWRPSINADSYRLVISLNADMSAPLFDQNLGTATSYQFTFAQDYSPVYWQVHAINTLGETSATTEFGIDRTPPTAAVTALPGTSVDSTFTITWSGADNDAGVQWYNVQYRDGNQSDSVWTDWQVNTTITASLFTGQPGHTYYFRAQAMDTATNLSAYAVGDGDTHTTIDLNARPATPWWNASYSGKRDAVILNNDSSALPVGYPIHLHFDSSTNPSASDLYNASLAANKGDDIRIVYQDLTELPRYMASFTPTEVDIWFNLQASIGPSPATDTTSYQIYYGSASATNPPGSINDVIPESNDANTLGLWHLQEGSGTSISDSSGHGNTGIASNMGWTTGKFGPAGVFLNANRAVVDLGPSTSFNTPVLTLEAWVNPSTVGGEQSIFRKQADDGSLIYDFQVQGQVWLRLNGNEGNAHGNTTLQPGHWYHIAGTFDGSTIRVYLNGVLDGSASYNKPLRYGTSTHLYLGGDGQNNNKYFDGSIQDARISNIVRSSFPYAAFAAVQVEPSTGAGSPIAPPQTGTPSLDVQDVHVYTDASGNSTIAVVVQNQGTANTNNGFATDLYLNHQPTGPGDTTGSVNSWVASPIASSQALLLTTLVGPPGGARAQRRATATPATDTTQTFYIQADSTGALAAYDNTSQTITGPILICTTTSDAYEPDNTSATATPIGTNGTSQLHNFDTAGDQDWSSFSATAGFAYVISTSNLGANADTILTLYGPDGTSLLDTNDHYNGGSASQIIWRAPASGTYYIQVTNYSPFVGGCGTTYNLSVQTVGSISLTAQPGACGETVTMLGINFLANEQVSVYLDDASTTAIASANASAGGAISITFTLSRQVESVSHSIIALGQTSAVPASAYLQGVSRLPSRACST